jgi:hypothetical protein
MVSVCDSTVPVFPRQPFGRWTFFKATHIVSARHAPLSSIIVSPELQTMVNFSEYLTSLIDDSPIDDLPMISAIGLADLSVDIFTSWEVGGYIDDDQPASI